MLVNAIDLARVTLPVQFDLGVLAGYTGAVSARKDPAASGDSRAAAWSKMARVRTVPSSPGGRMSKRIVLPVLLLFASFAVADAAQQKGRYKKQGTTCEWDANDSGPNQCTPTTRGRFKRDGDTCRWNASEDGADQCRPASGRWKKDGNACVWNGSDSGPDQCNPRAAR